jgi:transcription-repair coupling factor (superfamily II helicase)
VRDEDVEEGFEVKVELPIDAHIPHDYIPDERLRLAAYRSLANAHTNEAVVEVIAELADRYGPLPQAVSALIEVAHLRVLLHQVGVTEVVAAGNNVRVFPVELPDSRQARLTRLYPGTKILPATRTIVVPRPRDTAIGAVSTKTDSGVTAWVTQLVTNVMIES